MKFEQNCVIPASRPKLWDFLTDIPKVAKCLPGVEEVHSEEEGKYSGILALKVGVIKLKMSGKIIIEEMNAEQHTATMAVQAADHRITGLVQGKMTMKLDEVSAEQTKLIVGTDISLFGKIGEFGQPIIRKKADKMMEEFAGNVAKSVAAPEASTATA